MFLTKEQRTVVVALYLLRKRIKNHIHPNLIYSPDTEKHQKHVGLRCTTTRCGSGTTSRD